MPRAFLPLALLLAAGAAAWLLGPRSHEEPEPASDTRAAVAGDDAQPMLAGVPSARHAPSVESGRAGAARQPSEWAKATRRLEGRVQGADGAPLQGARVTVEGSSRGLEALSDADGNFVLEGAIAVGAVLRIEAPGFGTSIARLIGDGEPLVLRLAPGRTVSGVIVDAETGRGVAGVALGARQIDAPEGGPWALPALSASDGSFVAQLPGVGAHVLEVGSRVLPPAPTAAHEYLPTTLPRVLEGERDLRVALRRGLVLEVALVDEGGEPFGGAAWADVIGRTASGDLDYTRRRRTQVQGGPLRVPGLEPGRYDVQVSPMTGASWVYAGFVATWLRDVAPGTPGLTLRLLAGASITGRVVDAEGELVLARGLLYAYREGRRGEHPAAGAGAPGDGTFEIGPLERGVRYDVLATGFPGRRPAWLPGAQPGDLRLDLVLPAGGAITGRVLDAEGKPVPAGVPVSAFAPDAASRAAEGSRRHAYTLSDGTFTLDGLLDAAYEVQPGGGNSAHLGDAVEGLRPGATDVVLRVSLGVDLSGVLVDARGEPVAATSLQADDGSRRAAMRPYCQVGPDGKFRLRGLRAGRVRLTMRHADAWVTLGEHEAPAAGVRVAVPDP